MIENEDGRSGCGVFKKRRAGAESGVQRGRVGGTKGGPGGAADQLTDGRAMDGQHGVYCKRTRRPGKPTLDIALVIEQIGDGKELVQSVIELQPGRGGPSGPLET